MANKLGFQMLWSITEIEGGVVIEISISSEIGSEPAQSPLGSTVSCSVTEPLSRSNWEGV